jgi:hypothetical protein
MAKSGMKWVSLIYGQYSGESNKKQDGENERENGCQFPKKRISLLKFKSEASIDENDNDAEYSRKDNGALSGRRRDAPQIVKMDDKRAACPPEQYKRPRKAAEGRHGGNRE